MKRRYPSNGAVDRSFAKSSTSYEELLKCAGCDPKVDLRGQSLAGTDFEDCDVKDWDFSGCDLTRCNFSRVKNLLQAKFSRETVFACTHLPEGISIELLRNPPMIH